jgi:hypothetical protein
MNVVDPSAGACDALEDDGVLAAPLDTGDEPDEPLPLRTR